MPDVISTVMGAFVSYRFYSYYGLFVSLLVERDRTFYCIPEK